MIAATLFSLFVGDVIKSFYTQKAGDAALKSWKTYTQGNHDLQTALQEACGKTAATIALGLVQESLLMRELKFPAPQINREFAEMMDVRYVRPFCGVQPDSERQLRQNAKAQCKALNEFFSHYSFKDVSVEEIANLLYNVRFITNADLLREQTQLTKAELRDALSQAGLDPQFIAFLLFPEQGSGVLYDGIVYHFEEAIKANERVSRMLAHFDRQQLAASAKQTQQEFDGLKTQIAGLEAQIVQSQQARKFAEVSAVAQQLDALEQQAQKADATLRLLQENAAVWQSVETELTQTRQGFGLISQEIAGHFAELQDWLDTEFDEVKDEIKGHVSHEASEIMRFVRRELEFFFGAKDPAIQVEKHDFLSKTYRLWERYRRTADAPLGQGGLAEVWKVCKIHLQSTVALKVLLPKHRHDPAIVARFFAEGKIMGMLGDTPGHHFTKVREMGRSADDEYFIEMDFVPGKTLHALLKEQGAFAPPDALRLLRQLAAALRHAHERGIIHRDVKPQNIIVNADGQATLIDFGIAKRIDHGSLLTPGGEFYGTYQYAAPEQFDRKKFGKISERTDVYALGILGYQLLLNRFPFEADTQAEFIHAHCYEPFPGFPADANISTDIVAFIITCAQKRQDDRFQNMSDVETAIAAIFEHDAAEKYRRHCAAIIQAATVSPEQQVTLDDLCEHLLLNRQTAASITQEIKELRQQQAAVLNAENEENERRAAEDAVERQRIEALKRQQEQAALKKAEEERQLKEQEAESRKQQATVQTSPQIESPTLAHLNDSRDNASIVMPTPKKSSFFRRPVNVLLLMLLASISYVVFNYRNTPDLPLPSWDEACWKNPSPKKVCHEKRSEIDFVWIPGGTFLMGSPDGEGHDEEHPQRSVTLNGFWLGQTEVTQAQWERIMGSNPSHFKGAERPVEMVSWNDAHEFLAILNATSAWMFSSSPIEYRLPSEAEWEYAARAGTQTAYSFGNDDGQLSKYAWYRNNSNDQTNPVKQKKPNAFGLYDMHGNVWEWCADTWHDNYQNAPDDGSIWGSLGIKKARVLRGGSWSLQPDHLRSAYRNGLNPDYVDANIGFRVVVGSR